MRPIYRCFDAPIVRIAPMEDFYIGGASVKLFLPIFKMNFPEMVDIALPAEDVFHNLDLPDASPQNHAWPLGQWAR